MRNAGWVYVCVCAPNVHINQLLGTWKYLLLTWTRKQHRKSKWMNSRCISKPTCYVYWCHRLGTLQQGYKRTGLRNHETPAEQKLLRSRKKRRQGTQQWHSYEVNLMKWCGFCPLRILHKKEEVEKVACKDQRRKEERRASAGLSRRISSRCSRQFLIWNQMACFARRQSLQNSIGTNQLLLRTKGCFHCPTLKKLKQKTLKDGRNVVLSHGTARFIDARSRGQNGVKM